MLIKCSFELCENVQDFLLWALLYTVNTDKNCQGLSTVISPIFLKCLSRMWLHGMAAFLCLYWWCLDVSALAGHINIEQYLCVSKKDGHTLPLNLSMQWSRSHSVNMLRTNSSMTKNSNWKVIRWISFTINSTWHFWDNYDQLHLTEGNEGTVKLIMAESGHKVRHK